MTAEMGQPLQVRLVSWAMPSNSVKSVSLIPAGCRSYDSDLERRVRILTRILAKVRSRDARVGLGLPESLSRLAFH
jgi:hypothetical protein